MIVGEDGVDDDEATDVVIVDVNCDSSTRAALERDVVGRRCECFSLCCNANERHVITSEQRTNARNRSHTALLDSKRKRCMHAISC